MPHRIVVTGATGFLGTHLVRAIRTELPDAEVVCVGREAFGDQAAHVAVPIATLSTLPGVSVIFHLAGASSIERSVDDPGHDLRENAFGTLQVLEAARAMPGARVVLASSVAVYGRVAGWVTEDHPPRPISPYGVSKLAAEGYLRTYAHQHGVDGCVARIGNPYGPGQRRLAVYDLARRALFDPPPLQLRGSGLEVRDFVHASDVARALLAIALRGASGETYNVASGRAVTLGEVADLVAGAAGLPPNAVRADRTSDSGKVKEFRPSVDKLAALGYRPSVALPHGINETVAWVKSA